MYFGGGHHEENLAPFGLKLSLSRSVFMPIPRKSSYRPF
jgi:hypothetical protein